MANVVEPEDLAGCRIQKGRSIAIEVERCVVNALRVALGLREYVLRTQRDFLRFDDPQELAINDQRVVGGAICGGKLLNRVTTILAQRSCWTERRDLPAPLLQAGINP